MNQLASATTNTYWLEAKIDVLSVFRTPGFVLPSVLFPCVFYIFFGIVFNQGDASRYMMVNYIIFGIMGPALFNFGVNVSQDRENGCLALKRLSPMPAFAYVLAKSGTALVFSGMITLALFILGALFAGVSLPAWQWLSLFATALLGTLPFCLLGLWLGLKISAKGAPAIVNLIYLPMSLCSGLWMPIFMFPDIMQKLAFIFPSFHLSQLALQVIGASQGFHPLLHLTVLIGFSIVLGFACAHELKKQQ
jgi:ABC-2 type transport system permease protein